MVRAHSRATSVSVINGNSRRNSTAADSLPPRSNAARKRRLLPRTQRNIPGAWGRTPRPAMSSTASASIGRHGAAARQVAAEHARAGAEGQASRTTIRRTGRLLAPSMPMSSSTLPGRPPQPSRRMRSMMSRISISPCAMCVSEIIRSLPQRSQVMRRYL